MSAPFMMPVLMPQPLRVETVPGAPFAPARGLAAEFAEVRTERLERAVRRLLDRSGSGKASGRDRPVPLIIACSAAGQPIPRLHDDESYVLSVAADEVRLAAPCEWGVLRGLVTLTQLLAEPAEVAPLRIRDAARFPWRGLMLDVARHVIPQRDLLRTLNAMEVFKLNVLHLHLSDDQGFRFPSRRFPRLPSPEHYTVAELEGLVAEAADRGIRVIPELDVPGHTTSWLDAYPRWGNRQAQRSRRFGVHEECLDPTNPEVLDALDALFGEVAALFPDDYLHIGGDEVHPAWWMGDERIRSLMARQGLEEAADLQALFNRRLADTLERLGRRTLAWDEVLHDDLPRQLTVQSWRGATARDRAIAAGHDCVLSAPYYLDLFFPAGVHYGFDPAAPQEELLAREDALLEDPRFAHVAAGIAWTHQWRDDKVDDVPRQGAGQLLGAEACLWSELVDARLLDVRLWSRMPALAERFWSPAECRDEADLYRRLESVLKHLAAWAGVDVIGDSRRLVAQAGVSPAWQPLADVLEPVKWYGRLLGEEALQARLTGREMPKARPYDVDSRLDRVVDGLLPESLAARRLAAACDAEAAGDRHARSELLALGRQWAVLPPDGGPAELDEPAARLRKLGRALQQVLDGSADPNQARQDLRSAAEPMGEYLLAAAPVLLDWLSRRQGAARNRA